MNNNFFDKSVREKLEGHEVPVPADAWANIQKGKKKRRPWFILWLLAGMLFCGGIGAYLYQNNKEDKKVAASNTSSHKAEKTRTIAGTELSSTSATKGSDSATITYNKQEPVVKETNNNNNNQANADRKIVAVSSSFNNTTANVSSISKIQKSNTGKVKQNSYSVEKGKATLNIKTGTYDNDVTAADDKNDKAKSRRQKGTSDGKQVISIIPSQPLAEDNSPATISSQEMVDTAATATKTIIAVTTETTENKKDSTVIDIVNNQNLKKPEKKKRPSTGLEIDLGLSGFMPVSSRTGIASVSRTITTALHKADFVADKISIRSQPSTGLYLMLFKSVSSKVKIGAGVNYQLIKEYISLTGEETNTSYSIVKRLQGNTLVNDTVETVSKGIRNIHAVNSYSFLSIPISVRYQLMKRNNWLVDLQAGLDINLQTTYSNSIAGELVPQFTNANNPKRNQGVGLGFNAGIRLGRRVGKNYWFYAAPYLQLNPKTLYLKEMLSPATMHRAGISFGINYSL